MVETPMNRLIVAAVAGAVAATVWDELKPGGQRQLRRWYHALALSTGQQQACHWARKRPNGVNA
jgi:predicted methyltransferase